MKPEMWAVLTAICWAVGSVLEKKGVKLGEFTPVMGTTIRTVVSLTLLLVLSFSFWGEVKTAGLKPVLLIAVGGGVIAGCLGIVFLYSALREDIHCANDRFLFDTRHWGNFGLLILRRAFRSSPNIGDRNVCCRCGFGDPF